jgi:hypothetical protein
MFRGWGELGLGSFCIRICRKRVWRRADGGHGDSREPPGRIEGTALAAASGLPKHFDGVAPHTLGFGYGAVEYFEAILVGIEEIGEGLLVEEGGFGVEEALEPQPGAADLGNEDALLLGGGLVGAHHVIADAIELQAGGLRLGGWGGCCSCGLELHVIFRLNNSSEMVENVLLSL